MIMALYIIHQPNNYIYNPVKNVANLGQLHKWWNTIFLRCYPVRAEDWIEHMSSCTTALLPNSMYLRVLKPKRSEWFL